MSQSQRSRRVPLACDTPWYGEHVLLQLLDIATMFFISPYFPSISIQKRHLNPLHDLPPRHFSASVGPSARALRAPGLNRTGQSPAVEPCTRAPQSFLAAGGLQASDFIGCSSEKSLGIGQMRPTNRVTCRLNIEKSPFESQTKTVEYMRFPWHFGESLTPHRCLLCG